MKSYKITYSHHSETGRESISELFHCESATIQLDELTKIIRSIFLESTILQSWVSPECELNQWIADNQELLTNWLFGDIDRYSQFVSPPKNVNHDFLCWNAPRTEGHGRIIGCNTIMGNKLTSLWLEVDDVTNEIAETTQQYVDNYSKEELAEMYVTLSLKVEAMLKSMY
jgi:hypothetical protein